MIYATYDKWLAAVEIQLKRRGVRSVDRIGIDLWEYFQPQSSPEFTADSIIERARKEQVFFRADMSTCLKHLDALFKAMPIGKMQALIEACILNGIICYKEWAKWMQVTGVGPDSKIVKIAGGEDFGLFELFDLALAGANTYYSVRPSGESRLLNLGNLLLIEQGYPLFTVCPQELLMALNSLQKRGCLFTSDILPPVKPLQIKSVLFGCRFRIMASDQDPLSSHPYMSDQLQEISRSYWHCNTWVVKVKAFQDTYSRSFPNTQAPYFTHPDSFRDDENTE